MPHVVANGLSSFHFTWGKENFLIAGVDNGRAVCGHKDVCFAVVSREGSEYERLSCKMGLLALLQTLLIPVIVRNKN